MSTKKKYRKTLAIKAYVAYVAGDINDFIKTMNIIRKYKNLKEELDEIMNCEAI